MSRDCVLVQRAISARVVSIVIILYGLVRGIVHGDRSEIRPYVNNCYVFEKLV